MAYAFAVQVLVAVFSFAYGDEVGVSDVKPHIVVLLADNVGWAAVSWHKPPLLPESEVSTPKLNLLRSEGVELDRHYTYKFCSPSRSSFMSGRLPSNVNIYNDDPAMPGAGAPTHMRLMPAMLKGAGYRTHFAGKWHLGMASRTLSTPEARGFDSSLGYFHSTNNYYDSTRAEACEDVAFVDLWDGSGPSRLNGTAYEEFLFRDRIVSEIVSHDLGHPFFAYYALHTSCVGYDPEGDAGGEKDSLQPDLEYYDKFAFVDDSDRRANVAMVALMDDVAGDVVDALKKRRMWENTLFLWSSDNGGAVHLGGGSNTWPLRGGYYNNWEGGMRVPAFLAGGALPSRVRGTKLEGWIYIADWYATFARLAGVRADDGAEPRIDSLDVWDLISGANQTSPRTEWVKISRVLRKCTGTSAANKHKCRSRRLSERIPFERCTEATRRTSLTPTSSSWDSSDRAAGPDKSTQTRRTSGTPSKTWRTAPRAVCSTSSTTLRSESISRRNSPKRPTNSTRSSSRRPSTTRTAEPQTREHATTPKGPASGRPSSPRTLLFHPAHF